MIGPAKRYLMESKHGLGDIITEIKLKSSYDRAIKKKQGGFEYVRYQYQQEQLPERSDEFR